jgi:hypothetical protein
VAELTVDPENAAKVRLWVETRGGVLVWESANLGNPGASWTTPALTEEGQDYPRPTWEAAKQPSQHIRSLDAIEVVPTREHRRFRVAVRRGHGLQFVLTDAASRKVRKAVADAAKASGTDAWHGFDYGAQEAVIYTALPGVPLSEWVQPS